MNTIPWLNPTPTVWGQPGPLQVNPILNYNLFLPSEMVEIVATDGGAIRVMTHGGKLVASGVGRIAQAFPAEHYFVESATDRTQFAVLPADYRGASWLGMEGEHDWLPLNSKVGRIKPGWQRTLSNSEQANIEVQPGQRNWQRLDEVFANAAKRGNKVSLVVFDAFPYWYPNPWEPSYAAWAQALAARYGSNPCLAAVEPWNEPWSSTMRTPAWQALYGRLVAVLRSAFPPTVAIAGPSLYCPDAGQGGTTVAAVDIADWHDYGSDGCKPDELSRWPGGPFYDPAPVRVDGWRRQGNRYRAFVGEIGLGAQSALGMTYVTRDPAVPLLNWQTGAWRGFKLMALYRAAGVEVITPHLLGLEVYKLDWCDGSWAGWEFGQRGPAYKTTLALLACYWLSDVTGLRWDDRPDAGWCSVSGVRGDGKHVTLAWAREGRSVAAMPPGVRYTLFGEKVSSSTVNEEPAVWIY